MNAIPPNIANHILTIGPDYKNHRGGIGAILETYSSFFNPFHFISSFQPFNSNNRKVFFFLKQIRIFIKYLRRNKQIQIVHIHSSKNGSFYRKFIVFLIAKIKYKKKIIYHIHSGQFDLFYKNSNWLIRRLIKYIVQKSDVLICLSNYWKTFFKTNFHIKNIAIINNVVISPKLIGKKNNLTNTIKNVLFLGRIGDNKGIFDVIQAIIKNKNIYNNKIKLHIGGDGDIKKLKKVIEENKLQNIVEYVGWVSDTEKDRLLLKSDIYILPSYAEGLPISILEAMNYGIPIISTNVGGIPEIVKHQYNGILFQPGDIDAIENALQFFINQPQKIEEYGRNSLELIQPYLPNTVIEQLVQCYQSILTPSKISVASHA